MSSNSPNYHLSRSRNALHFNVCHFLESNIFIHIGIHWDRGNMHLLYVCIRGLAAGCIKATFNCIAFHCNVNKTLSRIEKKLHPISSSCVFSRSVFSKRFLSQNVFHFFKTRIALNLILSAFCFDLHSLCFHLHAFLIPFPEGFLWPCILFAFYAIFYYFLLLFIILNFIFF